MAGVHQGRPTSHPPFLRKCLPLVRQIPSHALRSAPDFSSGVIFKLMSFTFAMITLPIGTYFFTNAYVFNGN